MRLSIARILLTYFHGLEIDRIERGCCLLLASARATSETESSSSASAFRKSPTQNEDFEAAKKKKTPTTLAVPPWHCSPAVALLQLWGRGLGMGAAGRADRTDDDDHGSTQHLHIP